MADLGGPVRVAPYARFGTTQLAASAAAKLAGRNAVILRNHGALACGPTLERAYERASTLEWLARVYWYARLAGAPQTLSDSALAEVSDAVRALRYGEAAPPPESAPPSGAAPPSEDRATSRGNATNRGSATDRRAPTAWFVRRHAL
jgi:hypothetical protein